MISARLLRWAAIPVATVLLPTIVLAPRASADSPDADFHLSVLSGRADMVTGGDALVRVEVPREVPLGNLRILVNGADVADRFVPDSRGRELTGLVTGLRQGPNEMVVAAPGRPGPRAELTVVNYPIHGPVFSGPHQQPFACETTAFTMPVVGGNLGEPIDEYCSIETRVDYIYRTTGKTFKPWPVGATAYPADLATTTTSTGAVVPYVVRMETGTVNRAIYQTSILHDPLVEPMPTFAAPPPGWNGRAVYTLGGGCGEGWYRQGRNTGGVTNDFLLGQGYALMSSSLNVFGNNCSDVTAAESAMMVKERFIERYGPIEHTIGFGSSGGSYQAHQITDNYPGILDGIIVGASFPDVGFATVDFITDARLLERYFNSATGWTGEQKRAVAGFLTYATVGNVSSAARRIDPRELCSMVPPELRYDPDLNPDGVRCGVYDHAVNVYGRDPQTGFARRPLDNVGIQYGLRALDAGVISVDQFLDLNEYIGGYDNDANFRPERTEGDLDAIRIAYQTGRLTNGGRGLADIPIIDYRVYRDDDTGGNLHLRYHSLSMRARLVQANDTDANYVGLLEDKRYENFSTTSPLLRHAIVEMDQWLTNLAADHSKDSRISKIVRARPVALQEGCNTRDPEPTFIAEQLDRDPASTCERLYPSASFPREVAGEGIAADTIKCQLKAPDPADFQVPFNAGQWARLVAVFPTGVCDYDRPGMAQQPPTGTWLRY